VYFEDFTTTTQEDAPASRSLTHADRQNLAQIEAEIAELEKNKTDKTSHAKVFNGENCQKKETLHIKKLNQLGSGS